MNINDTKEKIASLVPGIIEVIGNTYTGKWEEGSIYAVFYSSILSYIGIF